jgi:hypothetical protein
MNAFAVWSCECIDSGAWANKIEVHGEDAAMIGAVGNVLANAFGVIVPFMGVALHSRTGSWVPHLAFGALLKLVATVAYLATATLEDARTTLARPLLQQPLLQRP